MTSVNVVSAGSSTPAPTISCSPQHYANIFKLAHAPAGFIADLLGALQVRYPTIPIVFADTRTLAEEWTYHYLGAALARQSHPKQAT